MSTLSTPSLCPKASSTKTHNCGDHIKQRKRMVRTTRVEVTVLACLLMAMPSDSLIRGSPMISMSRSRSLTCERPYSLGLRGFGA